MGKKQSIKKYTYFPPTPTYTGSMSTLEPDWYKYNSDSINISQQPAEPIMQATNYLGIAHYGPPFCPYDRPPTTLTKDFDPEAAGITIQKHPSFPQTKWYSI